MKKATDTIKLVQKYPEYNNQNFHHAIIIAYRKPFNDENRKIRSNMDGIDILINRFRNNPLPLNYKIYEVDSRENAQKVICDPKTTHLWIFGHGQRNKLRLSDGDLCYYEVKDAKKKIFIGQYHCNSILGKSLADYNNPDNSDVTRWNRITPLIRFSVGKKLDELTKNNMIEPNETFSDGNCNS
ncbi:hypothetical protein J2741_001714 [Methanolinea mesophila]|nr:hypothetical protein [Methanolinea mesophila]